MGRFAYRGLLRDKQGKYFHAFSTAGSLSDGHLSLGDAASAHGMALLDCKRVPGNDRLLHIARYGSADALAPIHVAGEN
jgi:hypothetical protein